jgi:Ca2+-binding RTX toxin-like protein
MTTYTLTNQSDFFPQIDGIALAQGDTIEALDGNDVIRIVVSDVTIRGGDGADEIRVLIDAFASFESEFDGGNGNDLIEVRGRNHVVDGGEGDDELIIIGRDSVLNGGNGDDLFRDNMPGRGYTSVFNGEAGNDRFVGNGSASTFNGGDGNDAYTIVEAEIVNEDAGRGTDTVRSSRGATTLGANIENLVLTGVAVSGVGNSLNNVMTGNVGNNTLLGGSGNDMLRGGAGRDVLSGGAGSDIFDFNAIAESTRAVRDIITDFRRGTDMIDLRSMDASSRSSGNQAFTFIGAERLHKAGELSVYKVNNAGTADDYTRVSADVNGDGAIDFAINVKGLYNFTAGDFML